jgi:tetratricopeptide (TPR) repeat protein
MLDPRKNNFRHLNAGLLTAVVFYVLVLYSVPLQSKAFYFDDYVSIVQDQTIKTIDIPAIFNAYNTRFLVGLSFALNYSLCNLHPVGYRLINLLIHCLNALLVYLLIKISLRSFGLRPQDDKKLIWPAFFGSMLFLCHPLQTEPVNFITQRFVLMGTFFYLLTLYLYIQYRCRSKKRYLIAAMASAIAAMFCKEFTVTLPVMLILYDFYFLPSETIRKRCSRILPFFIIALIVPILLLRTPPDAIGVANIASANIVQEGNTQNTGDKIDITRAWGSISRHEYFLTELNVICTYVRLLFLPVNQNLDYDYPLSNGVDAKTALCGVFLLCLLALAAVTYKSYRIISFGILWFFIALSVESSFIPIGHVIAEYRVYLASVGFVFLVAFLLYTQQIDLKRLNMIAAAILIGLSILTYQRNNVWRDEITLWGDALRKSPHKARPHYNHGFVYFHQGKLDEAMSDFNEAIKINPDAAVYINRGIIYYEEGKLTDALSDYNKAIKINPDIAEAYYNRGNAYTQQNNFNDALSDYNKAIELKSNYAEAYSNRGSILVKQGDLTKALASFNKAIEIYPRAAFPVDFDIWRYGPKSALVGEAFKSHYNGYAEAFYNRGFIYDKQGDFIHAISDYSKVIELNSDYADAYNNRGYIYSRQGNYIQAVSDFNKAIEINPNIAGYYYNRGIPESKLGNNEGAITDFTRAIEINPDYADAYYNRSILYYESKRYPQALTDVQIAQKLGAAVNPEFISALNKAL